MLYSITIIVASVRITSQDQPSYVLQDVFLTLETSFSLNIPYPITLTIIPAKVASQNQSSNATYNVLPTSKNFSFFNASTILTTTLVNAQFLTSLDILLTLETFFTNVRPVFNLNNKPLSKELLKTVSSNIWQKQPTTHKRKVPNLYEIVSNYSSSNAGSISVNSFFRVLVLPIMKIIGKILPLELSTKIVIKYLTLK